jgi:hypothetical protein
VVIRLCRVCGVRVMTVGLHANVNDRSGDPKIGSELLVIRQLVFEARLALTLVQNVC